jgi:tetratricopeptide (TPR) repeat protein
MPYLSNTARSLGENELAKAIADDFINNYLLNLDDAELYRADYMEFAARYTGSKDRAFNLFFQQEGKVDRVTVPGYSKGIVDYIITLEEIDPRLWKNGKAVSDSPDWTSMFNKISAKFGVNYADRVILDAKLRWYGGIKDWTEYCENVILKVERYGPYGFGERDFRLDGNAWDLFLHSTDKNELTKALSWSDNAIKLAPTPSSGYFDTYANLLYKLGRVREAIKWEEKAVALDPNSKDINEALEKMRRREPTWTVE